ncbi:hypothetical protein BMS3Abin09_01286 [bacterium BMS3Abin09]|nr:hypothetical protein BMS3Abin09_01286 [bacterium BMS3Abin09]
MFEISVLSPWSITYLTQTNIRTTKDRRCVMNMTIATREDSVSPRIVISMKTNNRPMVAGIIGNPGKKLSA